MAHDSDRPGAGHHHCDHQCQTCGAGPIPGLAACPYCRCAYAGVEAGITCPACQSINAKGRTVCAQCNGSLMRVCVFCNASTLLDLPACTRCHEPFAGAEERKRERASGRAPATNPDPTGANIFASLNSILKS